MIHNSRLCVAGNGEKTTHLIPFAFFFFQKNSVCSFQFYGVYYGFGVFLTFYICGFFYSVVLFHYCMLPKVAFDFDK